MKKFIFYSASLVVGVIMLAQPVSAVSMADLQGQINALMQILQQLIAQVAALPITPVQPPTIIDPPLPVDPPIYDGKLRVSTQVGTSPLTVVFTAYHGDGNSYPPSATDGQDTRLDFGDGTALEWVHCFTGNKNLFSTGRCQEPVQLKHTYKEPGTYTARLVREGGMCMGACPVTELATVKVTVKSGDIVACTKEYRPVCGRPAGCSPCPEGAYCIMLCAEPQPVTYANKCELGRAGATYLYSGKCQTGGPWDTNTAPVVDSIEGPTRLYKGEVGTWMVEAHDRDNDTLRYKVDWGDEPMPLYRVMADAMPWHKESQETTFEHSYNNVGRYAVAVTVTDGHGHSTRSTITVFVVERPQAGGGISPACKSWYDGCNTCGRRYPGGPAMCTLRACFTDDSASAYCKEYFND